jgi:hypothetical protein
MREQIAKTAIAMPIFFIFLSSLLIWSSLLGDFLIVVSPWMAGAFFRFTPVGFFAHGAACVDIFA